MHFLTVTPTGSNAAPDAASIAYPSVPTADPYVSTDVPTDFTDQNDFTDAPTVVLFTQALTILSLHNVQKKHSITYNSSTGTGFTVQKADGNCCVFKPSKKGLFYSDVKCDIFLVNTVYSIKKIHYHRVL